MTMSTHLSRDQKRHIRCKQQYLRSQNRKYKPGVFVEIPRDQWPERPQSLPLLRVMRSRDFLVQIYEGEPTRLSVNRTMINGRGDWEDGITWEELQAVKDGCGFADCDAVEAYPRRGDIVNVANIRHLWIVPPSFAAFFWRSAKGSGTKSGQTSEEIITGGAGV